MACLSIGPLLNTLSHLSPYVKEKGNTYKNVHSWESYF